MAEEKTTYKVEAVLSARDAGYTRVLQSAQKYLEGIGKSSEEAKEGTQSFGKQMMSIASAIGVTQLISKGWDMIRDSVGRAMNRMDTMDNFTRTMTLMTGSTEKANGALEALKEITRGTAYGLDTAAKSTQGLVTSGMELGKAVKYIDGWGNAVATFGDGTNETLTSVTFQLSQMAAKGKANLGDLKSAMEAGIPVIQLYAEATGQSAAEVSKDISAGKISAEEFMDVMDRAFREGTKSFPALTGAAKNAGNTWRGTFDNMAAATTRGMVSIIDAIEEGRKSAGKGTMKDAVASFGKVSEKVLNGVAKVAGFVAQNFETLNGIVVTGFAAWAGYKIVDQATAAFKKYNAMQTVTGDELKQWMDLKLGATSIEKLFAEQLASTEGAMKLEQAAQNIGIQLQEKMGSGVSHLTDLTDAQKVALMQETGAIAASSSAISLKSIAMSVLAGKIKLTTVASTAFQAAWKANPIGMIVSGVSIAVSALGALNNALNSVTEEHKKANEAAKEQASASDSLVKSSQSLTEAYHKNIAQASESGKEARRLVAELYSLENASMGATEKQSRMSKAVSDLKSKYPTLTVELDKTGTKIKTTTESIHKQIDAMEEMAKTQAMKDYLAEIYKKQAEMRVQIESNKEAMKEMEDKGYDVQAVFMGLGEKGAEGFTNLSDSTQELLKEYQSLDEKISVVNENLGIQSQKEFEAQQAADQQAKSLENLRSSYGLTSDQIIQYCDRTGESLADAGQKVLDLAEKYNTSTDQIVAAVEAQGGTLEEFSAKYDENLKRAEQVVSSFADTTLNGFQRIEQGSAISMDTFLENLRANGEATKNWADNMNALMEAGISGGVIAKLAAMGPAGAATAQLWVDDLRELNNGTELELGKLAPACEEKIQELNSTMANNIDIVGNAARMQMEAQDFQGMGASLPQRMAEGIANSQMLPADAASSMTEQAVQRANGIAPTMGSAGSAATKSMEAAIIDGSGNVVRAVDSMGGNAERSLKRMNLSFANQGQQISYGLIRTGKQTEQTWTTSMYGVNRATEEQLQKTTVTIQQSGNRMSNAMSSSTKNMEREFQAGAARIQAEAVRLQQGVVSSFSTLPSALSSTGSQAGNGFRNGLASTASSIYATANRIANTVSTTIRHALQVRSPSRVMREIGKYTGEGFAIGLADMIPMVKKTSGKIATAASRMNMPGDVHYQASMSEPAAAPHKAIPLLVHFLLGKQAYTGFVRDITETQDQEVALQLSYGGADV